MWDGRNDDAAQNPKTQLSQKAGASLFYHFVCFQNLFHHNNEQARVQGPLLSPPRAHTHTRTQPDMNAALARQRVMAVAVATSSLRAAWQRGGGGGARGSALSSHGTSGSGGGGSVSRYAQQHQRHQSNHGGVCGGARVSLGGGVHNARSGRKLVAAAAPGDIDGSEQGPQLPPQARGLVTSLSVGKVPKAGKQRLDELTIERNPQHSRTVVQSWIAQGKVLVDGQPIVGGRGMNVSVCTLRNTLLPCFLRSNTNNDPLKCVCV